MEIFDAEFAEEVIPETKEWIDYFTQNTITKRNIKYLSVLIKSNNKLEKNR